MLNVSTAAAPPTAEVADDGSAAMATAMTIAGAVIVGYWIVWFLAPDLVAPSRSHLYVQFEHAFPAADLVVALALFRCSWLLRHGGARAPLWAAFVVGGGTFLFLMDVSFALQHGLYTSGAGGLVELLVNAATGVGSALVARWLARTWP